jgi:hypothetical protein
VECTCQFFTAIKQIAADLAVLNNTESMDQVEPGWVSQETFKGVR